MKNKTNSKVKLWNAMSISWIFMFSEGVGVFKTSCPATGSVV